MSVPCTYMRARIFPAGGRPVSSESRRHSSALRDRSGGEPITTRGMAPAYRHHRRLAATHSCRPPPRSTGRRRRAAPGSYISAAELRRPPSAFACAVYCALGDCEVGFRDLLDIARCVEHIAAHRLRVERERTSCFASVSAALLRPALALAIWAFATSSCAFCCSVVSR